MGRKSVTTERGIIVFAGQARLFKSYGEAERYAESLVRDTDEPVQFATLVPNNTTAERTIMEQAVVVVDRGIVAGTADEAVEYGYLIHHTDEEE